MRTFLSKILPSTCVCFMAAGTALADMSVELQAPWGGRNIPNGQHCALQGGHGETPPMQVSGVPDGAVWLIAEFNDKSYRPLSRNGGHGVIGFPVQGAVTTLPAVPANSTNLPGGAQVVSAGRGTGDYASVGYLPPCSGGAGNRYSVDIKAVSSDGQVLETVTNVIIGRY